MSTTTIEFEEDMGQGSRDYGQEAMLSRLGELAKRRREELGLGRVPFAKQAGVGSDRTILYFELGRKLPLGMTLVKIEKALGWRAGCIAELAHDENRKASSVTMEELDAYDSVPVSTLADVPLDALLQELIRRLPALRAGLGGAAAPTQDMLGLAASGAHKPEHLDDDPDDDISGLNVSPN